MLDQGIETILAKHDYCKLKLGQTSQNLNKLS